MTELETQLLSIIEQQQNQLQTALTRLEAQANTIRQLEYYGKQLHEYSNKLAEKNNTLVKVIQNPNFSESLQTKFKQNLESHLEKLVNELNLNDHIMACLPKMVQDEIKEQITPLASEFFNEKEKIKAYHNQLSDLIQKISLSL